MNSRWIHVGRWSNGGCASVWMPYLLEDRNVGLDMLVRVNCERMRIFSLLGSSIFSRLQILRFRLRCGPTRVASSLGHSGVCHKFCRGAPSQESIRYAYKISARSSMFTRSISPSFNMKIRPFNAKWEGARKISMVQYLHWRASEGQRYDLCTTRAPPNIAQLYQCMRVTRIVAMYQ